jgi:ABC-type nitrate/sulfonate/bicarbonate transport system substrate-binding protein
MTRRTLGGVAGIAAAIAAATLAAAPPPGRGVTIVYGTRSGASWPSYIGKHGGYFAKYGLDVTLAFGAHPVPIAMVVGGEALMAHHGIDPALIATSKDGSLVALGSPINRGVFALVARKGITTPAGLKGKRVAVGRVGDVPYHFTVSLLAKFGLSDRQVQWVSTGLDASARATAVIRNSADASLLTAPAYFPLEDAGYPTLANLADFDDIFSSTVYLFTKKAVAADPKTPELIIRAQTESIKRFYDDKAFAVEAYLANDRQDRAVVSRLYDVYSKAGALERVPYVMAGAVQSAIDRADAISARQMRAFDYRTVIDNSVVQRLVREGFFERVFGPGVKAEQDRKAKLAFGQ